MTAAEFRIVLARKYGWKPLALCEDELPGLCQSYVDAETDRLGIDTTPETVRFLVGTAWGRRSYNTDRRPGWYALNLGQDDSIAFELLSCRARATEIAYIPWGTIPVGADGLLDAVWTTVERTETGRTAGLLTKAHEVQWRFFPWNASAVTTGTLEDLPPDEPVPGYIRAAVEYAGSVRGLKPKVGLSLMLYAEPYPLAAALWKSGSSALPGVSIRAAHHQTFDAGHPFAAEADLAVHAAIRDARAVPNLMALMCEAQGPESLNAFLEHGTERRPMADLMLEYASLAESQELLSYITY